MEIELPGGHPSWWDLDRDLCAVHRGTGPDLASNANTLAAQSYICFSHAQEHTPKPPVMCIIHTHPDLQQKSEIWKHRNIHATVDKCIKLMRLRCSSTVIQWLSHLTWADLISEQNSQLERNSYIPGTCPFKRARSDRVQTDTLAALFFGRSSHGMESHFIVCRWLP